ncbi:hypothetical protein I5L56_02600 [Pseudomonas oryzihabitans]|nr:hypothetical protein [Pseudomonas oryzihabitans]MBH3328494.1 hypothetical protein [Pseudomonas oryzihabitans]
MNILTPPRIQTPRGIRRQLAVIVTPLSPLDPGHPCLAAGKPVETSMTIA